MRRKRKKRVTWFSGLFIELVSLVGLFAIAMPEKGVVFAKYWLTQVQSSAPVGSPARSDKANTSQNASDARPIPGKPFAPLFASPSPDRKPSSTEHLAGPRETGLPPGVYPRYSTTNIHRSHRFLPRRLSQWHERPALDY